MIENKENIKRITMLPTAITLCDIGNDWYKNELTIVFYPKKYYPDYMKVQKWIMDNIDGKRLNIEQVVDLVYNYMLTYDPANVHITDKVTGNKVHFDVIVEK